jgi:hypothetical protein
VAVALKNRTRHPLALLIVAIAVLLCPLVTESARAAQQKQAAKPVAAPTVAVPSKPSDFVGEETCALCHADQASKFSSNPHSKLALLHGGKGVTCESCHGAGKAHVDGGGDITKIFRFSTASPKQIDATCLGCHAAAHPDFERSPRACLRSRHEFAQGCRAYTLLRLPHGHKAGLFSAFPPQGK